MELQLMNYLTHIGAASGGAGLMFVWLVSRMNSLERRMGDIESDMKQVFHKLDDVTQRLVRIETKVGNGHK